MHTERARMRDSMIRLGRGLLPQKVRGWLKERFSLASMESERRASQHPVAHDPESWEAPASPCRLGVLKEYFSYHKDFVYGCRDLGISYSLIDLAASDWIEGIRKSECDAFLAWPSNLPIVRKAMCDDRLRILAEDMGKIIYPAVKETWLYESKLRIRDWLEAHRFQHPRSEVCFDEGAAQDFVRRAELPLVLKTSAGASAAGVYILRDVAAARRMVSRAFSEGVVVRGQGPEERQRGVVFFQEYLADVQEWRMVRIGRSFFGYRKEKGDGEFHSASKTWSWLDPPRSLLDLTREVTDRGGFTSMNVDVFETTDGRLLVNELQTVFGATTPADQLRVDGVAGRYVHDGGTWRFEKGPFSKNACANLRIRHVVEEILGLSMPTSAWASECPR